MIDQILQGDSMEVLRMLPSESVDCCITSPPYYGLRNYGIDGQIGLEPTPEAYVSRLVEVFREVKRVLKPEGTLWLNLGDSYAGSCMTGGNNGFNASGGDDGFKIARQFKRKLELPNGLKPKDLIGIPWMVAFALRADGWYLRSDIIWQKPNCMPESCQDRPTKSHEYLFLLAKSQHYYYDVEAIKEDAAYPNDKRRPVGSKGAWQMDGREQRANGGGQPYDHDTQKRNRRTVWTIVTKPFKEAHFATFPEALVEPCILAGCPTGGVCLDPFFGAGTVGLVAKKLGRHYIGIELNPDYIEMANARVGKIAVNLNRFAEVPA